MEYWILFSILAALIFAIVNIIDKYVLVKLIKRPIIPLILYSLFGIIAAAIVFAIHGFYLLSMINIILALIAGILVTIGTLLYFKAVKIGEISRLIPVFHITPLFVLILATIFLGEIFTLMKYVGIFLIIIGAFLISSKELKKFRLEKGVLMMLLASVFYAMNYVIIKYLLGFADYWIVFSYTRIGAIFLLVPLIILNFKPFLNLFTKRKRALVFMSVAEILTLGGILLITIAISIGYVTLVNTLSNLQPFFVFLFATILSVAYPKILKEETKKSNLIIKFIAIALLFIGAVLII